MVFGRAFGDGMFSSTRACGGVTRRARIIIIGIVGAQPPLLVMPFRVEPIKTHAAPRAPIERADVSRRDRGDVPPSGVFSEITGSSRGWMN